MSFGPPILHVYFSSHHGFGSKEESSGDDAAEESVATAATVVDRGRDDGAIGREEGIVAARTFSAGGRPRRARAISVAREARPSRPDLARVVSDTARGATACVVAIVPPGERVRASVCVPAQRFGRALSLFAFFFAFLASTCTVIDVI
jgi:hypothetical protein